MTFETADVSFYSGNGAIYPTGNWDFDLAYEMLGEDLGIFEIPDYDQNCLIPNYLVGGNGQSMCVLKNTKYPKECADFLSWLSNKENTIKYGKHKSVLPLRRDITLEEYGYGDTDLHKKIYEMSLRTSIWHEYYMSPELADYYYIFGASTIIGNISLDEFVKKMDEKAKELSKNEKN